MEIQCQNCEEEIATLECKNCPPNDSKFCNRCWNIHIQVKSFKDHQNSSIAEPQKCSNCDRSFAVFQCRQCPEFDSLFCKECSKIHSQVKSFRDHTFISISPTTNGVVHKNNINNPEMEIIHQPSTMSKLLDELYSYFLYLMKHFNFDENPGELFLWIPESISELFGTTLDKNTIIFGLVIAFIAHLVIKLLLGKHSIYIIIAIGILGVRWLKRSQSRLADEVKKIEKKNLQVFEQLKTVKSANIVNPHDLLSQEEMKSEFWHDKNREQIDMNPTAMMGIGGSQQILPPKFKPRGPLYQGKKGRQRNENEEIIDVESKKII